MRRQSPIRDRFGLYLQNRVGHQQAQAIMLSTQKERNQSNKISWTPRPQTQFNRQNQNFSQASYPQSSLDSSQLCWSSSNSTQRMNTQNKKQHTRKTITIKKKRKLIKHSEIQQNTCSICLQYIKERAELSCKHPFCVSCLSQWLNTSSTCPYCRTDCPYYIFRGQKYSIQQKAFRYEADFPDWPDSQEDENDQLDYVCYLCERTQEGDTVLICDRCFVHSCHPQCDTRLRRSLRQDQEWYCHFCS